MTALTNDQQLVLPDYTEPADGPLDFYQFATGGLESRLVKRYASAADRTARNPSPQLNELSVRTDAPGLFEYWNGSAWFPDGGRAAQKVVKGVRITNSGAPIATTSAATELDLAKYQMTSLTLVTGRYYEARYLISWTKTVGADIFDARLRVNTAVSGTQVGQTGFSFTQLQTSGTQELTFIFLGDATYTSLYLSIVRFSGTGTFSYYGTSSGFNRSYGVLTDMGDPSLWSDAP